MKIKKKQKNLFFREFSFDINEFFSREKVNLQYSQTMHAPYLHFH